jgi:hypothetical protein
MGTDKLSFEGDRGGSDHCACLTGSNRKRLCPVVTWLFPLLFFPGTFFPVLFFSYFFPYFFKLRKNKNKIIWKSTGKNTKKKVREKVRGKITWLPDRASSGYFRSSMRNGPIPLDTPQMIICPYPYRTHDQPHSRRAHLTIIHHLCGSKNTMTK